MFSVFRSFFAVGRSTLGPAFLGLLLMLSMQTASAQDGREVVFNSWGGVFQEWQAEVILKPFQSESGIKVVQLSDGENMFAKVRSQSASEKGQIDIVHGDASWLMRGKKVGLWAKIDYDSLEPSSIFDDASDANGVGILYWSFNIIYNPKNVETGPTTWADVWAHAKAHPRRVALWGARPNYVLEAALMADGVAPGDVYPLTEEKIDRAYTKLDEIKNSVIWYESGAQGARLFQEGLVDVGMYYGGEAFQLDLGGNHPVVVWNQGLYTRDYWLVPANAPNKEEAHELIRFAIQAQRQAEFAERTGYGPVATDAVSRIEPALLSRLTSVDPNKSKQLSYDYVWWGENDDTQLERWTQWLRG
ncbi:extracellular solute-binding protein [Rhizobium lemnae]|uniref:Extracellular solute-binding protein n=1 Tax=Rhizobium lemnae TaxID=1214924 RepID=A0ABV8EDB8_9HYPH|nr:extracellular solute-binding protein [Rhizobium lemnae]MCJ8508671.1 extracellular solute-binding protein [Rhizobium lemnae]